MGKQSSVLKGLIDHKEACKIRMGPERIEKGWEAKVKKELFAKMHTLMSHIKVA